MIESADGFFTETIAYGFFVCKFLQSKEESISRRRLALHVSTFCVM